MKVRSTEKMSMMMRMCMSMCMLCGTCFSMDLQP